MRVRLQELCLGGVRPSASSSRLGRLHHLVDSFARYVPTKLALLQALNKDSEVFRACKSAMLCLGLCPIERAQQAGALRGRRRTRRRAPHGRLDGRSTTPTTNAGAR